MKFSCDGCKTRYSIADDRVRGKVLKIRCKNCSTVITVREERRAAPRGDAAGSAGVRAPEVAPPWFVATGGIQHGPMALADAMAWVAKRDRAELIYCWCDGFASWLPIEDVEHFADLREPPDPGDGPNFEGETLVAPPTCREGDDVTVAAGSDIGGSAQAPSFGAAPAAGESGPVPRIRRGSYAMPILIAGAVLVVLAGLVVAVL